MKRRAFLRLAGSALTAGAMPAAAATGDPWAKPRGRVATIGGRAFGSYWRAVLPAETDGHRASGEVAHIVDRIDAAFSPFDPRSELSRINAADSARWQPVSPLFHTVMQAALAATADTGGAFHPVRSAPGTGGGPLPGLRAGAIRRPPGATLDLCGIAKGHALDLIAAALGDLGIRACLVELGGELIASGWHPAARRWNVALEAPGSDAPMQVLGLANRAVATAGARAYATGGTDGVADGPAHIRDPRTGAPPAAGLGAVSVAAESATRADALATGLYAAGSRRALALAEQLALDAVLVARDGNRWAVHCTGRAGLWLRG